MKFDYDVPCYSFLHVLCLGFLFYFFWTSYMHVGLQFSSSLKSFHPLFSQIFFLFTPFCGLQLNAYFFNLLFMAVLGLRFCARAFSSCSEWGPLFIAVHGPLTVMASLIAEHKLQTRRLSSCGSRAQSLCSMWDLPRPGLEPVSPALAGRFSTTAPPGKPLQLMHIKEWCHQNHRVEDPSLSSPTKINN